MDLSSKEDVVTMVDILKEEEEMNEATSAVLGGSDENKCTYFDGYLKRQALYSCLTCQPKAKKDNSLAIGLCLACSLSCHENHDLIELYTKRAFRCDCGIKPGSVKCQLVPTKKINDGTQSSSSSSSSSFKSSIQPNERNQYNINFSGLYCTCLRPYPDDEDNIDDIMIQCVCCENWYHSRHLQGKAPDQSAYSEMICDACMSKNEFLQDYIGLAVESVDAEESKNNITLNVTSCEEEQDNSVDDESAAKKLKLSEDACIRPKVSLNDADDDGKEKALKSTFWKQGWRQNLCKCVRCIDLYEKHKVDFLIDEEDTVHFYEEVGSKKTKSNVYDESMQALSSLSRVNQVNAVVEYNKMKDKLFEFLQSFVTANKIVTDEDIRSFFQTMKTDSNENQNNVHQPHFCR